MFAFVPPPAGQPLPPAGEPLHATRARCSRGWREVERDPSLDGASVDVVLSPPLHRQRPCDFEYRADGPLRFEQRAADDRSCSSGEPFGVYLAVRGATIRYAPPASNLS